MIRSILNLVRYPSEYVVFLLATALFFFCIGFLIYLLVFVYMLRVGVLGSGLAQFNLILVGTIQKYVLYAFLGLNVYAFLCVFIVYKNKKRIGQLATLNTTVIYIKREFCPAFDLHLSRKPGRQKLSKMKTSAQRGRYIASEFFNALLTVVNERNTRFKEFKYIYGESIILKDSHLEFLEKLGFQTYKKRYSLKRLITAILVAYYDCRVNGGNYFKHFRRRFKRPLCGFVAPIERLKEDIIRFYKQRSERGVANAGHVEF